ncbi:hypothetical protein B4135_0898 [Caldibacillus debilis]|uniref:Uncharacterized protein n=1 Tax=Caldibacillus debilis TaxID=301148 RepID=A0A150M7A8_9BACI|nr:hypothetical protein B4135_0898 [Caldibacillus debilis]
MERQSEWFAKAETLSADRGYDDTKLIEKCWGPVRHQTSY